jgi:hypothetical protein
MPFPERDDARLIVAWAGQARCVALYNLAAHPDRVGIEFEGRKTAVTQQTLSGAERASAWEWFTPERPSFAETSHKTVGSSRSCVSWPAQRSCRERPNG